MKSPTEVENGEIRAFGILFQKIFGSERYARFMWEMREENAGATKSIGQYPIQTLRAQPESVNVTSLLDKKRATNVKGPRP